MSFRSYLILMTIATVTAWIAWAVVIHGVDPSRSGVLGFLLFYGTLSMALFGTISILGILVRLWRLQGEIASRIALRSFRQAVLFSVLFITSLLLFSQGWFRWWTMILVVIIIAFIELLFVSSSRNS